ncbi:MAG: hypothetical protein HY390_05600 [Deltaproteobacteria bacterium]|nr:hypothetical protein [Deltaproteobacteria bacterium]
MKRLFSFFFLTSFLFLTQGAFAQVLESGAASEEIVFDWTSDPNSEAGILVLAVDRELVNRYFDSTVEIPAFIDIGQNRDGTAINGTRLILDKDNNILLQKRKPSKDTTEYRVVLRFSKGTVLDWTSDCDTPQAFLYEALRTFFEESERDGAAPIALRRDGPNLLLFCRNGKLLFLSAQAKGVVTVQQYFLELRLAPTVSERAPEVLPSVEAVPFLAAGHPQKVADAPGEVGSEPNPRPSVAELERDPELIAAMDELDTVLARLKINILGSGFTVDAASRRKALRVFVNSANQVTSIPGEVRGVLVLVEIDSSTWAANRSSGGAESLAVAGSSAPEGVLRFHEIPGRSRIPTSSFWRQILRHRPQSLEAAVVSHGPNEGDKVTRMIYGMDWATEPEAAPTILWDALTAFFRETYKGWPVPPTVLRTENEITIEWGDSGLIVERDLSQGGAPRYRAVLRGVLVTTGDAAHSDLDLSTTPWSLQGLLYQALDAYLEKLALGRRLSAQLSPGSTLVRYGHVIALFTRVGLMVIPRFNVRRTNEYGLVLHPIGSPEFQLCLRTVDGMQQDALSEEKAVAVQDPPPPPSMSDFAKAISDLLERSDEDPLAIPLNLNGNLRTGFEAMGYGVTKENLLLLNHALVGLRDRTVPSGFNASLLPHVEGVLSSMLPYLSKVK